MNLSPTGGLWRMVRPLGRAYLTDEAGTRTAVPYTATAGGGWTASIPPGTGKRTLVLAEPSGEWKAAAGGASLAGRTVDGWAQGFDPPAAGGRVTVEHEAFWHDAWLWIQLALVALILVLASPGARGAETAKEYAEVQVERESEGVLVQ